MGFFDKIKKAFSAEKKEEEKQEIVEETVDETPSDESAPAESKETAAEEAQTTPETTAEEYPVVTDKSLTLVSLKLPRVIVRHDGYEKEVFSTKMMGKLL